VVCESVPANNRKIMQKDLSELAKLVEKLGLNKDAYLQSIKELELI
jgi:hypothetical protein